MYAINYYTYVTFDNQTNEEGFMLDFESIVYFAITDHRNNHFHELPEALQDDLCDAYYETYANEEKSEIFIESQAPQMLSKRLFTSTPDEWSGLADDAKEAVRNYIHHQVEAAYANTRVAIMLAENDRANEEAYDD